MVTDVGPHAVEDLHGVEDDDGCSREIDKVKVSNDQEERFPDIRPGEVTESCPHGESLALVLHGLPQLLQLLADVLRLSEPLEARPAW